MAMERGKCLAKGRGGATELLAIRTTPYSSHLFSFCEADLSASDEVRRFRLKDACGLTAMDRSDIIRRESVTASK